MSLPGYAPLLFTADTVRQLDQILSAQSYREPEHTPGPGLPSHRDGARLRVAQRALERGLNALVAEQ